MASYETLDKLREHPEWIPPRSDTRVFLGEPGGPEGAKTTVEPGNSFSPGMATYGVAWWLKTAAGFFTPEQAAGEALTWSFEEGYLPVVHCDVRTGGLAIRHSLFQDGTCADQSESVCGKITLQNTESCRQSATLYLVLRSLGPAGGPLPALKAGADGRSLWLPEQNVPALGADRLPQRIACGVGDPSAPCMEGDIGAAQAAEDEDGWCYGVLQYELELAPGDAFELRLECPIPSYGVVPEELPGLGHTRPALFEQRAEAHLAAWRQRFAGFDVEVPDRQFREAFFANLQHMLVATVGDQIRLAPISYPLPWMRDSVAIMRSLDLAGYHELARATSEICVRQDFFGGFCAEADSPGQAIWALVEHYRITGDRQWLERVYPSIRRKCDWIFKMRRAEKPIQIVLDTPVLPFMQAYRNAGTICLAAKDGIVMGVMDLHIREGETNQWCICGLLEAAHAAAELGYEEDASAWQAEAEELRSALLRYMEGEPRFFEWERNVNSLVWPTRTWEYDTARVEAGFRAWWAQERGSETHYLPERFWLHFELGQIHNALMLGLREQAWQGLEYRLEHQDVPGLYGWREYGGGFKEAGNAVNGVTLIRQLRGCQTFDKITPHGWCASEMWLLQRGMLVEEWQGGLNLFSGVPKAWVQPGAAIGFTCLPTWYGRVTARAEYGPGGQLARVRAEGLTPGTKARIMLPGLDKGLCADNNGVVSFSTKE